jgi:hypothetical protein
MNIKSLLIIIDGVMYRAENLQPIGGPADRRRLTLSLHRHFAEDGEPMVSDKAFHARADAMLMMFTQQFPCAPRFKQASLGATNSVEWQFALVGAKEEYIEWAKSAMTCGLIDAYLADYDLPVKDNDER